MARASSRQYSVLFGCALSAAPLIIAACSTARYSTDPGAATLVLPARFGEGQGEPGASSSAKPVTTPSPSVSASASVATTTSASAAAEPTPTPVAASNAPDPTPQRSAAQVQYELELRDGTISVVSVTPVKLAEPIVTPRRVGRYAIELTIGKELIERLRFDFPATAADEPQLGTKKSLNAPLTLSQHAIGHLKLLLPQNPRVRRAALIDRATNTATELPWPLPPPPPAKPAASATNSAVPSTKPAASATSSAVPSTNPAASATSSAVPSTNPSASTTRAAPATKP